MADTQYRYVGGMSELRQTIREFPRKLRRLVLSQATSAAARPIRDQARKNAPEYHGKVQDGHPPPGTLKRDIIMARDTRSSTDTRVVYKVLVRRGQRLTDKQLIAGKVQYQRAYYWWFVENGTTKMDGRFFMRTAFRQKSQAAIDAFAERLRQGVRDLLPQVAGR